MSQEQPQQQQPPQQPPPPPQQQPHQPQTTGLQENVAGMLCYLGWWITGVLFLFLEPNNKNIRFHAWQAIIISVPFFIVWIIFMVLPYIWVISWIIFLAGWVLMIYMMYMTYQGKKILLPIAGPLAEKWVEQSPFQTK